MKKSRFNEEQTIGILKQGEAGIKTADLCREHGISAATFYGWKQKYGGMEVAGLCCINRLTGSKAESWRLGWVMFKRRRFPVEIILLCVRWYCKYGISYRDLVEMMQERGVDVDPSTIMRWVHRFAPELEKRVRWYQGYRATSWRVDETYVKVGGRWKYLFRAVDKHGRLIDFLLADRRNTRAAHRFLGKALTTMRHWPPSSITTDQLGSYPKAISWLQREGKLSVDVKHRTCKYLNNIIEADHGALKRVIRPTRGFKSMKTASATIKGFEVMRMIRRGHCLSCKPHAKDEVRFVNKLFDVYSSAA